MPNLSPKQKDKRDSLVTDLDIAIKDKTDLIARLTTQNDALIAEAQNELETLTLKRDGLKKL